MISDDDLYRLAIFLGSAAMLLIVLYHFLEINAVDEPLEKDTKDKKAPIVAPVDVKVAAALE